jgi:chromosome segregation ATPase
LALEKAQKSLATAKESLNTKRKELRADRKEAEGKAEPPEEIAVVLEKAQKAFEAAEERLKEAEKAYKKETLRQEKAKRITKKMRDRKADVSREHRLAGIDLKRKGNVLKALEREARRSAVLPEEIQEDLDKKAAAIRRLETRIRNATKKVKGLEEAAAASAGPDPKDVAAKKKAETNLKKRELVRRSARRAITKKEEELENIKSSSKGRLPPELSKKFNAAKALSLDAKNALKVAEAEFDDAKKKFDSYKRPPRRIQELLAAAKKKRKNARYRATRTQGTVSKMWDAMIDKLVYPRAVERKIKQIVSDIEMHETTLAIAVQNIESLETKIETLTARIEAAVVGLAGPSIEIERSMREVDEQLHAAEEMSKAVVERIHDLEALTKTGPLTKVEKSTLANLERHLKSVSSRLALMDMMDQIELASTMGYGRQIRAQLAHQRTCRVVRAYRIINERWERSIAGAKVRIRISGNAIMVEELPTKPLKSRQMRQLYVPFGRLVSMENLSPFLTVNLVKDARFRRNMTYDSAVLALFKAIQKAKAASAGRLRDSEKLWQIYGIEDLDKIKRRWEEPIHYLQVEPPGYEPIEVQGDGFAVKSEWNEFKQTTFYSDDPHDPSYSMTIQKSPAAARKLYRILAANPDSLRGVSDFTKWLDSHKIKWDIVHSQWR